MHLVCDERRAHAARTIHRHAPSGRWCSDKIRRLERPKPGAYVVVTRSEYIIRGMVDRHGASDDCSRCETGHGSHSEKCAEIPPTPATTITTAPATTSASTSVPTTTTSKLTLDAQTSVSDVPMQATSDQSGAIKRPIKTNSEMEVDVSDVDTDLATLVIDQQPRLEGQ